MNNFTKYAAMLVFGWFCFGCGKIAPEQSVPVPADCQKFLDKYFEAVKSKDIAKIQEFSSHVSHVNRERMPEESIKMMGQTQGKFAVMVFQKMTDQCGDFESYSVLVAKETTVTREELEAKKMEGTGLEGNRAQIVCKARFSKKNPVQIDLHLFKETPESDYWVDAWSYQAAP